MNKEILVKILKEFEKEITTENIFKKRVNLQKDGFYKQGRLFFDLKKIKNIGIVCIGKNAFEMGKYLGSQYPEASKLIVIPENLKKNIELNSNTKIIYSTHPFMSKKTFEAGVKIKSFINKFKKEDLIIFGISGGSSALADIPADGYSDKYLIQLNKKLLNSGKSIKEINRIRQSVSSFKGGKLLFNTEAKTVSFILSDIGGDNYELVGSGPTVYASNFKRSYKSPSKETIFIKLASPDDILGIFAEVLNKYNYKIRFFKKNFYNYPSRMADFFKNHIDKLNKNEIIAISGECSLKVEGDGYGGRIQHSVLKIRKLARKDFFVGGIATDGIDGVTPENVRAVFIDENIKDRINKNDVQYYLKEFNSYKILEKTGALITGEVSGTNFSDIYFCGRS
ncbi:MAG: DUF4147 domain-containing protein [Candidatus Muiribacteriota bacterium]